MKIEYGSVGAAAASFQRIRNSPLPLEEVVARLKAAIVAADLWVLHEINPQKILSRGGYEIGAGRQILFFHPNLMARLLQADPSALIEAPLKFAIVALPDGTVTVRWIHPVASFGRYDNAALAGLGRDLSALVESVVEAALGPARARCVAAADEATDNITP
jgi:uncharacterized protein (DUF302 family)